MKLCLQILLSKAALTAAARRPKDTRLFDKIGKNGLNSGFLQSSQQKAYLIRLAILLYYSNIVLVIRCQKAFCTVTFVMIYCCSVILSPILSNKKQADKIEKSRINTDFFSILSNKKLFLGSIGRMAAAAICAELIKKCVGAHPCVRPGRKPLFSCSKSV